MISASISVLFLFFFVSSTTVVLGQVSYLRPLQTKLLSMDSSIRGLQSQLSGHNARIAALERKQASGTPAKKTSTRPVAHACGRYSGKFSANSLLSQWSVSSYCPSLATGGMRVSRTGIVVPLNGLYYVYAQLRHDPHSSDSSSCAYQMRVNSRVVAESHAYTYTKTGYDDFTKYTGVTLSLRKGDQLRVSMRHSCTLSLSQWGESFLGAFFLSYNQVRSTANPAAMVYGTYSGRWSSGSTLSRWNSLGSSFPSYSQGGSSYGSSYIRLPKSGLYYIFSQLQMDPHTGDSSSCGYELRSGSSIASITYFTPTKKVSGREDRSEYTGVLRKMSGSEQLKLVMTQTCSLNRYYYGESFLGAFYLPYQNAPAIHMRGILYGTKPTGTTLTGWNRITMSVNNGNVRYSSSGFTVPKRGIYYTYVQLMFKPRNGEKNCAYELRTRSKVIAAAHHNVPNPAGLAKTVYTGSVVRLGAGDVVSVRMRGTCTLGYYKHYETFLGGFFLGS